jgi:hypothetical protein
MHARLFVRSELNSLLLCQDNENICLLRDLVNGRDGRRMMSSHNASHRPKPQIRQNLEFKQPKRDGKLRWGHSFLCRTPADPWVAECSARHAAVMTMRGAQ